MSTLSREPVILAMANGLRLTGPDPVTSIIEFCRNRVAKCLQEYGPALNIWDVERIVCERLNLEICEIWNDDELDQLIDRFVTDGDVVFAHLKPDLDEKTFATLIRRKTKHRGNDCYVAVIDCRGQKGSRKFFSRWHEIAHLLTLYRQMEFPFHRSRIEKDPIEQMMDIIAGEIGFYEPMFVPILDATIRDLDAQRLTFGVVESVQTRFCPDASFQATLNACAARCSSPVILLEVGMGYKKTELRQLNSPQMNLIPSPPPRQQLRVLNAIPNNAARKLSIQIPRFMRVPSISVLRRTFDAENDSTAAQVAEATENLQSWVSSNGSRLVNQRVIIEARKIHDRVFGIVTPI